MDILACPVCKGALELRVDEENEVEVLRGTLFCGGCDHAFPIEDGIPDLRPPDAG